jgi:hypothetical protein
MISWVEIDAKDAFPCATCGELLRLPAYWTHASFLATAVLSVLAPWLAGVRGYAWWIAVAVVFFPMGMAVNFAVRHYLPPPTLQLAGESGPGLHLTGGRPSSGQSR